MIYIFHDCCFSLEGIEKMTQEEAEEANNNDIAGVVWQYSDMADFVEAFNKRDFDARHFFIKVF